MSDTYARFCAILNTAEEFVRDGKKLKTFMDGGTVVGSNPFAILKFCNSQISVLRELLDSLEEITVKDIESHVPTHKAGIRGDVKENHEYAKGAGTYRG